MSFTPCRRRVVGLKAGHTKSLTIPPKDIHIQGNELIFGNKPSVRMHSWYLSLRDGLEFIMGAQYSAADDARTLLTAQVH